jgi:hypothetical protein
MSYQKLFLGLMCMGLLAMPLASAWSTPAASRVLGLSHRLISSGETLTVELTVKPTRDFDKISVESGSGVKTILPECHFDGVSANTSYTCRLEMTGTASDAFMTLNVIGLSLPPGGGLAQTEVQHLTFRNGAFQKSRPTASFHTLTRPSASH